MTTLVTRPEWGANPLATPAAHIATPTAELWLHHTGSTGLHGASGMRSLQSGAIAGGYVDLEYSFVVDNPDGAIYESRGPGRDTAATGGRNSISSAICAMGNFETDHPSDALLSAIAELVAFGARSGWWPSRITGPHRDAPGNATACCGANLIAQIGEINRRAGSSSGPSPAPGPTKGGAVEICATKTGHGYWVVDSTGAVFAYGDAKYCGGANALKPPPVAPIVGMTPTPDGGGYWLLGADGGIFSFGNAKFYGAPTGKVH